MRSEYMLFKYTTIFLVILATCLRLVSLNQSLWLDEAIGATLVRNQSAGYIWNSFARADTHPPLYYIVLEFWSVFFGFSEVALRLPSVIAGVLTVFVTYLIGKEFISQRAGFLAGLLMATSGLNIYYSQEARMYALSTLLTAVVVFFYAKKWWYLLSLAVLALAATDYLPMLIILVVFVWEMLAKSTKKHTLAFLLSLLPTIGFYIYWADTLFSQIRSTTVYLGQNMWWSSLIGFSDIKSIALVWTKFTLGRISFDDPFLYALITLIVSLPIAWLLMRGVLSGKGYRFLIWLTLPLVISFLTALKFPGFSYFRLGFLLVPFYLLIANGLIQKGVSNTIAIVLVCVNLVFALCYLLVPQFHREDWRGLVAFVEANTKNNEYVFVNYSEPFTPYVWYATRPNQMLVFSHNKLAGMQSFYTLDYLLDATDPNGDMFAKIKNLGYQETNIYNFRGTGQLRYWQALDN